MNAPGYTQETQSGPVFFQVRGPRLVIVERVGSGLAAGWGFTIWREGCTEKGRCSWSWDAATALAEADRAVAKLEQQEAD